jgi:NAD(P)H-dependent flavin oxidoreductase YrpB (nitropropane dioxygenase family)
MSRAIAAGYVLCLHELTEERLALMLFLRYVGLDAFGARDAAEARTQRWVHGAPAAVVVAEPDTAAGWRGSEPSIFVSLLSVRRWLASGDAAMPDDLVAVRAVLEALIRRAVA